MANKSLVTPVGRVSFLKIYKAELNMAGTASVFSCKLAFPKTMDMSWIQNAWDGVAMEEFKTKSPGGLRPLFSAGNPFDDKGAIMDGDWKYDSVAPDKKDLYEPYRGMWIMGFTAPEGTPPAVVDENKNEILDQSQLQSGDFARCAIELSSYISKKFKTANISIKFGAIQKDRTGEHFAGGMSAEKAISLFDELQDMKEASEKDDMFS